MGDAATERYNDSCNSVGACHSRPNGVARGCILGWSTMRMREVSQPAQTGSWGSKIVPRPRLQQEGIKAAYHIIISLIQEDHLWEFY